MTVFYDFSHIFSLAQNHSTFNLLFSITLWARNRKIVLQKNRLRPISISTTHEIKWALYCKKYLRCSGPMKILVVAPSDASLSAIVDHHMIHRESPFIKLAFWCLLVVTYINISMCNMLYSRFNKKYIGIVFLKLLWK